MGKDGFTLVEIMIVVSVMGILLTVATLSFNNYTRKAQIEGQMKTLYSDMAGLRSEAMFRRSGRYAQVAQNMFSVFSSSSMSGNPLRTTVLKNPVIFSASDIRFNERGLLAGSDGVLLSTPATICVAADNGAGVDSIIIGIANIQMGKRDGACDQAGIKSR